MPHPTILLPVVLLGVAWLAGCATLNTPVRTPHVSLVDVRLVDVGLFEQRYTLVLRVQNPNPRGLAVNGMDYTLSFNGAEFARGVSNQEVVLPAYGEALVSLELISSLAGAVHALTRFDGDALSYRLDGGVSLGGSRNRLPFHYEGRLVLDQAAEPPGLPPE